MPDAEDDDDEGTGEMDADVEAEADAAAFARLLEGAAKLVATRVIVGRSPGVPGLLLPPSGLELPLPPLLPVLTTRFLGSRVG